MGWDGGLHERDAEVDVIADRVAALADRGGLVLVEGRAGAGKTALVHAGAAAARQAGTVVAQSRAREHGRGKAGATAEELLAGLDGRGEPRLAAFVESARRHPTVLAVDDLHLADAASVALLAALVEEAPDLPLLLLLSVRPAAWPDDGPSLDELRAGPGATVLRPRPLTTAGVAEVLGGRADAEAVTAWTAGLPGLVRAVAEGDGSREVPVPVLAGVAGELRRRPDADTAVLQALSVLGPRAPLRRVARLAGLERPAAEAAADRLARAELLTPGDPLSFVAPLEAEAVRATLEPFALARAHRHAADLLREDGGDVLEVGDHLLAASPDGDAEVVAALRAAARAALDDGVPQRASSYLERALREPVPEPDRDDVVLELVDAEAFAGRPASVELLEHAVAKLGDGPRRANAARRLTELFFLRGAFEDGARAALQGLDHCGDDPALREALLGDFLAVASFAPSLRPEVEARFGEVMGDIARGGPLPDDTGLLAQVAAAVAIGGAPRDEVMGIVDELLRRVPTLDGPPLGNFADWICVCCYHADDLDLCGSVAKRSSDMAQERGNAVRQGLMSFWLGMVRLAQGRLNGAVAHFNAGLRRQDAGWELGLPYTAAALCRAEVERGRLADAARALAAADDAEPGGYHDGVLLESRGRLALAEGRPSEALALFEASGSHLKERFFIDAPTWITWRSNAVFALRAMDGDLTRARTLAEEELALARTMGGARHIARALRALAAAVPGTPEAVDVLREARTVIDTAPERLEHPHALTDLGEALLVLGHEEDAKDVLREALELAVLCDAGGLEARARALLRRAGVRPRRVTRTGPGSLTPTEARVAELAASGLQNRQIARALTVSDRTVESHLYSVFRKLGISRRADLARHVGGE